MAALIAVSPVWGAFEGRALFQTPYYSSNRITPLAIATAAQLPGSPIWAAVGRGNLLNQKWADYNTIAVGGRWGKWRGSGSVWSSGDELYRETIGTVAVAWPIGQNIVGGFPLAQAWLQIKDTSTLKPQNIIGLSATGQLGKQLGFTLSYAGLEIGRQSATGSYTRQTYRLGLHGSSSNFMEWALDVTKTPGFASRYGTGVQLSILRNLRIDIGYRTNPAMPQLGASISAKRFALLIRVINHDIFGISKGFGISFK